MAKAVDDADLWLASPFLAADEDVLGDKENNKNGVDAGDLDAVWGFPSEFPYEFDSFGMPFALSSPVGSVAGSTETESSDEEDFFAGLTRRLSQSSLHESRKQLTEPIFASDKAEGQKTRGVAGSPQSTLSGIGSWSGRSAVSGDGSPNGPSQIPSPPMTPFSAKDDPWEVVCAAAGQAARLKMNGEVSQYEFQNRGLLGLPRAAAKNPSPVLFPNQSLPQTLNHPSQVQHQQVRQDYGLKQHCASVWGRQAKPSWLAQPQQEVQNRGRDFGFESLKCARSLSLPQSAWPHLQVLPQNQQLRHSGSGSRAVMQAGSGVKRGCAGTGVFLPRHYGNPSESRKKTSCAPVVLPAKVVHALNLNTDGLNATSQPHFSSTLAADYDALLARRNTLLMLQRLSVRREEAANSEIRLPQEWTY